MREGVSGVVDWKFVVARVGATFVDLLLFTLPALLISSAPTLFGLDDGVIVGDRMVASLLGCALMFAGRSILEVQGKSTPGRMLFGLAVEYGGGVSVGCAIARNSWALIPAIGWLVVFFASGQEFPWNDNPFDLIVFVLLGMIVISKDGSHIFDKWAKARVSRRQV